MLDNIPHALLSQHPFINYKQKQNSQIWALHETHQMWVNNMYESNLSYMFIFFHKYLLKTYYIQVTTLSSSENTKNKTLHVSLESQCGGELLDIIITEIQGHFSTAVAEP